MKKNAQVPYIFDGNTIVIVEEERDVENWNLWFLKMKVKLNFG